MLSVRLAAPRAVRVPEGQRPWTAAQCWRVVHVGQSAVILGVERAGATAELLALTDRRRGLVAGGVCLPDDDDFAVLVSRLAGTSGRAPVDLSGWDAVPRQAVTTVDLRIGAVDVDPRAVALLAGLLDDGASTGLDAMVLDPRPLRALAAALTGAALAGDTARVASVLARLVGAGPGATPTGDDVIVGALAALDAVAGSPGAARAVVARQLLARRLRPLLGRTTAIARHDLSAALAGEFAEHVHRLVSALSDQAAVPAAVAAARTWGATSGVDLASGITAALACLISAPVPHRRAGAESPSTSTTTDQRRSA